VVAQETTGGSIAFDARCRSYWHKIKALGGTPGAFHFLKNYLMYNYNTNTTF